MKQKKQIGKIKTAIIKVALVAIIVGTVVFACRKASSSETRSESFDVATAKEWYYASFRKSPEYTNSRTAVGQRLPDWKHGKAYRVGNMELVEFPLVQQKKQRNLPDGLSEADRKRVFNATLDKVVFARLANGKVVTRIVEFAPTLAYLQNKGYDISSNDFNKMDKNFSGNLYVYKWNGEMVKGLVFENGKSTRKVAKISRTKPNIKNTSSTAPNDNSGINSIDDPVCDYHVIFHYTQTCYVTITGDVIDTECDDPVLDYIEYEEYNCDYSDGEVPCTGENLTEECICENYGFCEGDGIEHDDEDPCKSAEQEAQNIAQAQFTNYINDESNSADDEASPSNWDPYTKIVKWNVVKHVNNIWRVSARTKYTISWDHPGVIGNYDKNLVVEHLESKYEGSNDLVISDWTPGVHNESVANNHTQYPTGNAFVSGSLHHKMKADLKINIPGCGEITINPGLETTKDCSNTLTISCP